MARMEFPSALNQIWRFVRFGTIWAIGKTKTPMEECSKVTLLHGCFPHLEFYKWYQIAQSITHDSFQTRKRIFHVNLFKLKVDNVIKTYISRWHQRRIRQIYVEVTLQKMQCIKYVHIFSYHLLLREQSFPAFESVSNTSFPTLQATTPSVAPIHTYEHTHTHTHTHTHRYIYIIYIYIKS